MSCLFNSFDPYFKQPFGAVRAGQTVRLSLRIPEELGYVDPHLVLKKEGKFDVPVYYRMNFDGQTPRQNHFSVEVPLNDPGLYFYYFDLYTDFRRIVRGPDNCGVISWQDGESWQITVYEQDFETPESIKGKVFYQIFPDRFCEGVENKPMPFADRIYQADKHAEPFWQPNEVGGHLNEDYFGGDLKGIQQKLPYLHEMGVDFIYLNPIFEAHSNHRYNTADYLNVDPLLGTNEEFRKFVANCHARGQKVIVDGVFNHVGRDFFAFKDLQANRENARYKDWFCDVNFWGNNEYNDGFSYGNWGGFNLLVKLNQRNPEVQNYHYDTIRFWVDAFDIDGIRLDAADVLDFDFMKGLRRLANEVKPEFWLMGEVIHGDYSRWANPEMLHSVTNYELHKGLWSGHNDHNYFEIAHTMRRLQGLCHDTRLYTFSDNHDVERLPNKLRNKAHIRHIAILVYTLWGIPSIYYGSEFGIEGKKEWGSDWPLRPCLELDKFRDDLTTNPVTSVYAALGRLKAEYPALSWGEVKELQLTTQCYAFARVLDGKALVAVFNNGDGPAEIEFQLPVEANTATDLLADTVGAENVMTSLASGRMKVQLPSNYATVLRLD